MTTITTFFFIGNTVCGGNLYFSNNTFGSNVYYTIESENYPNDYDNNLGCQFIISVGNETGFYPQLHFVDVALASGDTISVSC